MSSLVSLKNFSYANSKSWRTKQNHIIILIKVGKSQQKISLFF